MDVLRRLRWLVGAFVGYAVLVLVGFWAAAGMMHPTLLLAWFALQVTALFVFILVALLERLFGEALDLREDHDLTV